MSLRKNTLPIIYKSLIVAVLLLFLKEIVLSFSYNGIIFNALIEISDISIVFTGAFFVVGLLLAATMTDFKESEILIFLIFF